MTPLTILKLVKMWGSFEMKIDILRPLPDTLCFRARARVGRVSPTGLGTSLGGNFHFLRCKHWGFGGHLDRQLGYDEVLDVAKNTNQPILYCNEFLVFRKSSQPWDSARTRRSSKRVGNMFSETSLFDSTASRKKMSDVRASRSMEKVTAQILCDMLR